MAIGSDIMMALDTCVPSTCSFEAASEAVERTDRWAERSLRARARLGAPGALFGIVQGACYPELRRRSAAQICEREFDGFAIGGLAVGEGRPEREEMAALTAELLPREKPRYLMGVGTPIDLLEAVHRGVDMFDCIWPTAIAQQGVAYTSRGRVTLRRGAYRFSEEKLDAECPCSTCAHYSRAYLHHLTKAKEILVWQLVGLHNLYFYHRLMSSLREAIIDGSFTSLRARLTPSLENEDESYPVKRPVSRARPELRV
jgi:queuine tRNA-ribosyltransferase